MPYQELAPHPALEPFVDRFWTRFHDEPQQTRQPTRRAEAGPTRILPDGCIDVLFEQSEEGSGLVVGTMTRAIVVSESTLGDVIAVRFKPGGAVPFLEVRADELTDRVVPLDELGLSWRGPRDGRAPRLAPRDRRAAIAGLEGSLLERLGAIRPPDPHVAYAASALFARRPPSVRELARELGWSRQHLARAVRNQVGIGPKELGRVARVQRAVDRLQRSRSSSLAETALDAGYFDQAHMCRDFQRLAGVSPVVARSSTGSIFPIRSLLGGA